MHSATHTACVSFGYRRGWSPTVTPRCANCLLQVLILAPACRIYGASCEMFSPDFMSVWHRKALVPSPGNEILLFTDVFLPKKKGRNKLTVECVIYSRKFCSFSLLRQNKQIKQTTASTKKNNTAEPYLLLDAIFMPLDQCLGWSSIFCLQLNCGHKTFHHEAASKTAAVPNCAYGRKGFS